MYVRKGAALQIGLGVTGASSTFFEGLWKIIESRNLNKDATLWASFQLALTAKCTDANVTTMVPFPPSNASLASLPRVQSLQLPTLCGLSNDRMIQHWIKPR